MQFWRMAFDDYSGSATRITQGLASLAAPTFGLAASEEMDAARDYITFPEPEEAARPGRPRDRRAA
jgi:hypothetical protein